MLSFILSNLHLNTNFTNNKFKWKCQDVLNQFRENLHQCNIEIYKPKLWQMSFRYFNLCTYLVKFFVSFFIPVIVCLCCWLYGPYLFLTSTSIYFLFNFLCFYIFLQFNTMFNIFFCLLLYLSSSRWKNQECRCLL